MPKYLDYHGLETLKTDLEGLYIKQAQKGIATGVATLDNAGKVPSSQLPSYVDDVIEGYLYNDVFYEDSAHTTEITPASSKIYVDLSSNKTYRWSGSAYTEISQSLALGTTSSTAYRGDRGNTAYTHATDANRLTTAKDTGFYKIAATEHGHVKSLTAVTKEDITSLGVPGDITEKADKVASATSGNFAGLDANGNLTDSGHKHSDYLTAHQDISGKADKVSGATNGNFAALDSNGNLTDSGKKASDFGTYSKPSGGIPGTDLADTYIEEPSSDGTNGQVLTTDGNGGRSWTTVDASSIIDDTAGDGDTDKVWSADKVSEEFNEVQTAISQINSFEVRIVQQLPLTGDPHVVYFVPKTGSTGDVYDEYMYVNNAWELIGTTQIDLSSKADKVSGATNGNFAGLDSNGNLTDSGHKHSDYLTEHQDISGKVNNDVIAVDYDSIEYFPIHKGDWCLHNGTLYVANTEISSSETWTPAHWDACNVSYPVSLKADKVSSATSGNFAGLDSNGNLTDSGKSASDFGTYSKPSGGIPASDLASGVLPVVPIFSRDQNNNLQCDMTFAQVSTAVYAGRCTSCGVSNDNTSATVPLLLHMYDSNNIAFAISRTEVEADFTYGILYKSNGTIEEKQFRLYFSDVFATNYNQLTFPIAKGTLCYYDGTLNKANQTISTSEDFDYDHWDMVSVADELAGKISEPSIDGTNGQVLTTDGNGGRSWTTVQGGGGGSVNDVQVNGTSVVTSGTANIPVAASDTLGVIKKGPGLYIDNGVLGVNGASSTNIKGGTSGTYVPVSKQHELVFYGLAKVAGSDEKDSQESVGTYTSAAKTAIKTMLGVTDPTVTDVKVNGTSAVDSNGVAQIPVADGNNYGTIKVSGNSYGVYLSSGTLRINQASANQIKGASTSYCPVTPDKQHNAVFYGLATAAGDSTQSSSSNAVGTYTADAKTAIKTMLGVTDPTVTDVQVDGTSVVTSGVGNVPKASSSTLGVIKVGTGVSVDSSGSLSADNEVLVSSTQPSETGNKLWIDNSSNGNEYSVPTVAELNALSADVIHSPASPSSGDFLVYNGSAWVAQSLSTWQGGNY